MSISILSITPTGPSAPSGPALFGGDLPLSADALNISFGTLLADQVTQLTLPGQPSLGMKQAANSPDNAAPPLTDAITRGRAQWTAINAELSSESSAQTSALVNGIPVASDTMPRKPGLAEKISAQADAIGPALSPTSPPASETQPYQQEAAGVLALISSSTGEKGVKEPLNGKNERNTEAGELPIASLPGNVTTVQPTELLPPRDSDLPDPAQPQNPTIETLLTSLNPPLENAIPLLSPIVENRPVFAVDRDKPVFSRSSDSGLPAPQASPASPAASRLDALFSGTDSLKSSVNQPVIAAESAGSAANLAAPSAGSGNSPPAFASLINNQSPASQAPARSDANPVSTPMNDQRWPQEFNERIVWIAKNDQQQAQINITPAQLGPVQITLNLNGDQASINFASPHAEVRKAIEEAMPNLREMLSASGINLGQSNVGSQLPQQQQELPRQFANEARATRENAILLGASNATSTTSSLAIQRGRGMVDLFA